MEEVKNVSNVGDGVSNNNKNTLDSHDSISAASTADVGDREGNGTVKSNGEDVNNRSEDEKERSRSRSKERSRKHKRRHRSRDRDRRRSRSKSKDRDDDSDGGKGKDKDKDRERKSSRRDRERRRRSSRSRSRERDRHRRSSRDRDRDRDRDRRRDRERRDRDRRRSRSTSRRRDSRDRDRSEERHTDRRRERQAEQKRKEEEDQASGKVTLRDVITQNPGISVPDALQRMHAINTAIESGSVVPPVAIPAGQTAAGVGLQGVTGAASVQMQYAATKTQREIYVGNIPPHITIPQLSEFINEAMKQLGLAQPSPFGGPVVTCWISTDGHYAFIEMRTIEEAQAALTGLSGVSCGGYQLRVGRPKTSAPAGGVGVGLPLGTVQPLGVGQVVAPIGGYGVGTVPLGQVAQPTSEVSNVLMVANLPDSIGEAQVREILEPFGTIKVFNFIKVPMNGSTGGAAVLEYEDPSVGAGAIAGLNGLPVGDKQLSVQRVPANMASLLLKPNSSAASPQTSATPTPTATTSTSSTTTTTPATVSTSSGNDPLLSSPPTAVLRMSNMLDLEELKDDEIYEELLEDIADECNQHGTVRSVIIPRQVGDVKVDGVGEVFVCFTNSDSAQRAKNAVHGRTFNGQSVKAVFYPENLFHAKTYVLPCGYSISAVDTAENDVMD